MGPDGKSGAAIFVGTPEAVADIAADIETRPVIRGAHRNGTGLHRKIRGRRGSCHRNDTQHTDQKLFHDFCPFVLPHCWKGYQRSAMAAVAGMQLASTTRCGAGLPETTSRS